MGTGCFPGVKQPGRGVDHPPPSSTEVKERVGLYLYSPFGLSWPVLGWTLPSPLPLPLPADTRARNHPHSYKNEGQHTHKQWHSQQCLLVLHILKWLPSVSNHHVMTQTSPNSSVMLNQDKNTAHLFTVNTHNTAKIITVVSILFYVEKGRWATDH